MDADRWQRVNAILEKALERTGDERPAFVAVACAGDTDLQRDVEVLLSAHDRAGSFLSRSPARREPGSESPALTPGARLGPYEVTAKIGEGGMGEVYRARDTKLERDVALKVLPSAFTDDPERLARFEREARVMASLSHENVGSIYGFDELAGVKALVLELVEGASLEELIAEGPLPVGDVLLIAEQIAAALEAAHKQGIVHRDLKPANVKVTAGGAVKVLDFGLAKTDDPQPTHRRGRPDVVAPGCTDANAFLGTTAYMSPEQARRTAVDVRADIWAFGVVIYEMLTGKQPFVGETTSDVLAHIVGRDPDLTRLPTCLPARVHRLICRCLAKDPTDRLGDIGTGRTVIGEALLVWRDRSRAAGEMPTVAVLPFASTRTDPEHDALSHGIAEEIINTLGRIQGVRVAARVSSFAFQDEPVDAREVGERLRVGALLEGSVQRSRTRLRVTVQLIATDDGCQLWSGRYDRQVEDVLDVQAELARTIAGRIEATLKSGCTSGRATSPDERDAYETLLHGRASLHERG